MIRRRNISYSHRPAYVIQDIQAATIADKVIGIVPVRSRLIAVKEVHGTAGNDEGVVIASIERLQGTETSGNGDQVVISSINLKGAANTVQSGNIVRTSNIDIFEAGDRVGFNLTGKSTSLANMIITCYFMPFTDGDGEGE